MQQTSTYVPGQRWHEYRRTTGSLKKKIVLQEMEKAKERESMSIETAPTLYDIPTVPISKTPGTTNKMVAQILQKQEEIAEDIYIDKAACGQIDTILLIHQAVEELGRMPTLIVVSNLRYMAHGTLMKRIRYFYQGINIPIVPADGPCIYDVRVYGAYI